jgi:integrase
MSRGDRLDASARGRAPVRRGARVRRPADVAPVEARCGARPEHEAGPGTEVSDDGQPERDRQRPAHEATSLAPTAQPRQLNLLAEVGLGELPDDTEIVRMLVRGRCRDSSIKRYLGAARAWLRYCHDRGEEPHDASTATLLRWLDWRCRESTSPASAIRMSLAAARFVQRGRCVVLGVETVPYTPRARIQLDAWCGAATLNSSVAQMARPLRLDDLAELVSRVRADLRVRRGVTPDVADRLALRDAAMLLVGWWGALRADDLGRLAWGHVHFCMKGVELHIPFSKTTSCTLALAQRIDRPDLCPWGALIELNKAHGGGAPDDSVFGLVTGGHVGRRIKQLFARYDVPRGYSAHSLRAGFATECASQGVPDRLVQLHGRWRSTQQHAEYVRAGRLWLDTPTERIVCPSSVITPTSCDVPTDSGGASAVEQPSPATTTSE